jgi:AcrR family transcriptional regulator
MARALSSGASKKVSNDSRELILQAAIRIIDSHGAGALTVRSVAAGAGCSTTGVYTWFGGKNGLVEAIFVDGFHRFGQALMPTLNAPGAKQITLQAHAYRTWALENPTHYMVMFGRAVPDFRPSVEAQIVALATFQHLVDATQAAIEHGLVEGQRDAIAHFLWAGIHGFVSLEMAGMTRSNTREELDRQFAQAARRLLLGYAPVSSASEA